MSAHIGQSLNKGSTEGYGSQTIRVEIYNQT